MAAEGTTFMARHGSPFGGSAVEVLLKLGLLGSLFGGPVVVIDALRPLIGKTAAIIVGCSPIILIYLGADALRNPDSGRWSRRFIRMGIAGIVLLGVMNAYALGLLIQGQIAETGLTVIGLAIGTILIVVYGVLAYRALATRRPAPGGETLEDFGGPIE